MKIKQITKIIVQRANEILEYDKFIEKERPSSLRNKLACKYIA